MDGHAKKCVERYCELANKTTQQLYEVSTPCIDDHHFKEEETKSVGELSTTCSQIVPNAQTWQELDDLIYYWSVNKLARSITKWTKACDKHLNRLISKIHHTSEYKQYCHVGNTAKQCRLGLFQDSDFAGDLEDSKSTSGGTLCIFGSHTFVPISWMCKKQTSVSHSSTESAILSLGTSDWDETGKICSRILGSDSFCFRKHVSDFWETEATRYHWQESKILREDQRAESYWLCSLKRSVFASRSFVVCVWRLKQWSKLSLKEGVLHWDMFPGLTELLLIGCSIESTWTQESKSSTSTPKTKLLIS